MPRDNTERQQSDNKLMRVKHLLKHFGRLPLHGLAAWALACPLSAQATTTNVNVTDVGNSSGAYVPDSVTINVGDKVTWTWVGTLDHTVTSRTSVWPSMDGVKPFTFSFTFTNAGLYGYFCEWHGFTGFGRRRGRHCAAKRGHHGADKRGDVRRAVDGDDPGHGV